MTDTVDQKLLKQTKFPAEFNQKVDMQKVNIEVMKKWIAGKISEILGGEDDVVIELCFNLLEGSRYPNIKVLQIQLTGFLDKDTASFCKDLWTLCLSAQSNPQGVPKELLEAKKLELIQEKIEAEKAAEEARRRREQEQTRERDVDSMRQRERGERGRGRGRGGRGGRDFDRRPRQDSRSPMPRRSPEGYRGPPRRETDTYIPPASRRNTERRPRRFPSPRRSDSSSRSPSRSISPPRRSRKRSASPSMSRSPTPPPRRHRRYSSSERSKSRSRSRDRYRGERRERAPRRGDHRARSATPTEVSSSPSPRRRRSRRERSLSSPPPSDRSPPRRAYRRRSDRYSRSRSRSLRRSPSRDRERPGRARRDRPRDSRSYADHDTLDARADVRKGRNREERASPPHSRSPRRERKRYRSIERYEPRAKRRRNTSSVEVDRRRVLPRRRSSSRNTPEKGSEKGPEKGAKREIETKGREETTTNSMQTATELREKMLKEKLMAQRRTSRSQPTPGEL